MGTSLGQLRKNGFTPGTVLDIGAYVGNWSSIARSVWPHVPILMVDANPEREAALARAAGTLNADYRIALLGPNSRDSVPYYLVDSGSSVLPELTSVPRRETALPMTTLDSVVAETRLGGPYLLKMDVQGYEVEVLRGASRTLESTDVILLEVATMQYNQGAPLFAEVVHHLAESGFLVYDICGQFRRESDQALYMMDLLCVRRDHELRKHKPFWNIEKQFATSRR